MAAGTASKPITFTSALPASQLPVSGAWGGVIVLGKATIAGGPTDSIEGLPTGDGIYGGSDDADNSGTMQYVRIWYGGSVIGQNNEINGLTLGGVGSGTTLDHIEIAHNLDDGIEFFGGAARVKYLSVLFCGDDGIDSDQGWRGKIQYAVVVVGKNGHHALEMDSKTGGDLDSSPRSRPQLYNALLIGGSGDPASVSSDDQVKGIARLREGTAGEFGNIVLANIPGKAVLHADCGSETHSNAATNPDDANTLWFSSNNLIVSSNDLSTLFESCGGALSTAEVATSSGLLLLPSNLDQSSKFMDFRPGVSDSPVYQNIDAVPADGFFDTVTFKGAMDKTNWMAGWSILSEAGKLPADITGESLSGTITADKTLSASTTYLMTGQVFVKSGATLTIEAGTTIYAYGDDGNGAAPALVIEQGAKIMAAGTASNPITFTSAADPKALPKRGLWGGVIVLGKATIAGGPTDPSRVCPKATEHTAAR